MSHAILTGTKQSNLAFQPPRYCQVMQWPDCRTFEAFSQHVDTIDDPRARDSCCIGAVLEAVQRGDRGEFVSKAVALIADEKQRNLCCEEASRVAIFAGQPATAVALAKSISDERARLNWCGKAASCCGVYGSVAQMAPLLDAAVHRSFMSFCCTEAAKSAAEVCHLDFIKDLLQTLADGKVRDQCLLAAIECAADACYGELVSSLMSQAQSGWARRNGCLLIARSAALKKSESLLAYIFEHVTDRRIVSLCLVEATKTAAELKFIDFVKSVVAHSANHERLKVQCCIEVVKAEAAAGNWDLVRKFAELPTEQKSRVLCYTEAVKSLVQQNPVDLQRIDALLSKVEQFRRDDCCCEAAQYAAQADKVDLVNHLMTKIVNRNKTDKCLRNILFNTVSVSQLEFWQKLQIPFQPKWLLEEEKLLNFLASCAVADKKDIVEMILEQVQLEDTVSELLFKCISAGHVALAAHLLQRVTDVDRKEGTGLTALMLAAERGHESLIEALLDRGASKELVDNEGHTALVRAQRLGQTKTVRILRDNGAKLKRETAEAPAAEQPWSLVTPAEGTPEHDVELSMELHQRLSEAGFTAKRAQCLQEMADLLESAARSITSEDRTLTGSYAEGWANSLVQLNGRTDADSDIDWTILVDGEKFHLDGGCQCPNVPPSRKLKIFEGHALLQESAGSQPAVRSAACGVRPAQDTCHAFPCCSSFRQERIALLLPDVQQAASSPVHLVRATRPNRYSELRVSFSFQEKELMRRLSTVQGQLFVLLKSAFKKLLPSIGCHGLKTYHAKSLLFHMLAIHSTEPGEWEAANLVKLLKKAVDLMLQFLKESKSPDVCMPHFFMPDAPLYFKNAGVSETAEMKLQIISRLGQLRQDLSPLAAHLRNQVKPLESNEFFFHPFTLLPLYSAFTEQQVRRLWLAYQESCLMQSAYCLVHQCLLELGAKEYDVSTLKDRLFILGCLPDFCDCVVICLKVLIQLKLGKEAKARQLLKTTIDRRVRTGLSPTDIGQSCDWFCDLPSSAWRFCFPCLQSLCFSFLPPFTRNLIAVRLSSDGRPHHLYLNFRCLLWSLRAELLHGQLAKNSLELALELALEDPDISELEAAGQYCSQTGQLDNRHKK